MTGAHFTERPMAAPGLASFRYAGRFDWIMIGARDADHALREAARSTTDTIDPAKLQVWNGQAYEAVT